MANSRRRAIAAGLRGILSGSQVSAPAAGSADPELVAFMNEASTTDWVWRKATDLEHGKGILQRPSEEKARLAADIARCLAGVRNETSSLRSLSVSDSRWRRAHFLRDLLSVILRTDLPLQEHELTQLLEFTASPTTSHWVQAPVVPVLRAVERYAQRQPLAPAHLFVLQRLLDSRPLRQETTGARKLKSRIEALIGGGECRTQHLLDAGDKWADEALAHIGAMDALEQDAWQRMLEFARTAAGTKPSGKWLKHAQQIIAGIGSQSFVQHLSEWLGLVGQPGKGRPMRGYVGVVLNPTVISEPNADVLKGLAWCVGAAGDPSASRMLADLAEICFKKIPVHGARCPRVGNACLAALNLLPGPQPVGELSRLRSRVKQPSVRAAVEKAIDKSAQTLGVSRDEVEEMSTPTYGLASGGTSERKLGSFTAQLSIIGTADVAVRWTGANGKTVKSVPAEVKRDHAEELKELLRVQKDVQKMLPAQVQRMERLLLEQREWPLSVWRERYLDHPLLAHLTKRLIWRFTGSQEAQAIWNDGRFVRSDGTEFVPADDSLVRLWHPIDSPADVVLAWRKWLEERQVTQPFKQAHRELYILTDAERQTRTYSNRFAAHVLRQHQFSALCQARGWKYRLMGGFDSANTPTLLVPRYELRVEFWVEQPADDELSPAGISLRVVTDQVRFHRTGATEPLSLDQVPPLVFSEIMRDVDLFVGVASVGNDPTWRDGGPQGRFQTYWEGYSFGELSATAQTRRAVLESLLPRLSKIRERCSLSDRFLVVRGDIRTYKIHLGSGNILMEPNDQYLCIVPSRSTGTPGEVFLPFEGDATLSIILSKAFLLAEDKKIRDETIVRQIAR